MNSIGIVWAQFGPYHYARAAALQKLLGVGKLHAIELANQTSWYEWKRSAAAVEVTTLCPGAVTEHLTFWPVFRRARRTFAELKLEVCILPGYWPKQSLAALLAAKSLGIRTVMMNESHAGTSKARGVAAWVKRRLAGLFDAALVGGLPQKRYYEAMGMPVEKIFTGYDAVDNDFFAGKAEEISRRKSEIRGQYVLPEHYFLSLGRFLPKKNLTTLICAYAKLLVSSPDCQTHLVMVGSGEEEPKLRAVCHELKLPVYDKTAAGIGNWKSETSKELPGVHFYGFRQIEENPVFYALADAFILPSLWEEWGLVVNEAMASGLPVVVSKTAGCAEDLLETGWPARTDLLTIKRSGEWPDMDRFIRQNGFVFDPESVESLANIMIILSANPRLRNFMGQNSRTIIEQFSCENFAKNALLAVHVANGERVALDNDLPEKHPLDANSKLIS